MKIGREIFIDGETVTTIGTTLYMEADIFINASGGLVIPGGIDPHTHGVAVWNFPLFD